MSLVAYDAVNQLKYYSRNSVDEWYVYDASGQRVKKITHRGTYKQYMTYIDGVFTFTRIDEPGQDGGKQTVYIDINGPDGALAEYRAGDQIIQRDSNIRVIYILKDHLGSCGHKLLENNGLWRYEETTPFGQTVMSGYRLNTQQKKFVGKEQDESGLYYYGARYYDPWQCRFVTVDPLWRQNPHDGGYVYAGDNPIMFTDPTGMSKEGAKGGTKDPPVSASDNGGGFTLWYNPETGEYKNRGDLSDDDAQQQGFIAAGDVSAQKTTRQIGLYERGFINYAVTNFSDPYQAQQWVDDQMERMQGWYQRMELEQQWMNQALRATGLYMLDATDVGDLFYSIQVAGGAKAPSTLLGLETGERIIGSDNNYYSAGIFLPFVGGKAVKSLKIAQRLKNLPNVSVFRRMGQGSNVMAKFKTGGNTAIELTEDGMDHILNRHHPAFEGGVQGSGDLFASSTTELDLIEGINSVLESGVKLPTSSANKQIYSYRTSVSGKKGNYRVVVNSQTNQIMTFYPHTRK